MKILIVEDDQAVALTLEILFSSHNYAVDLAGDAETGLAMVEAFDYDLIVLDVLLPKMDGISLCRQLRTQGFQSPILLLTGQGEGRQKAIALNTGADDYVVKPFDADELIARVQALLRRGGRVSQPILTWGELSIDPSLHQVSYRDRPISLTPKEYAILELFLRNPRTVLSLNAILDHVWTSVEFPGEAAVRVHIKEVRQKLKAVGAPADLIKTVHRVGYQLNSLHADSSLSPTNPLSLTEIAALNAINQELRVNLASSQQKHQALTEQLQSTQAQFQQEAQALAKQLQSTQIQLQQSNQVLAAYRKAESEQRLSVEPGAASQNVDSMALTQPDLLLQQQMYQALINNLPIIIERFDCQLRHLYASPAAAQLTGIPIEQFPGKTCRELGLPSQMVDSWEAAAKTLLDTSQIQTIEIEIEADGLRYFEMRLIPELIIDNKIASILCISQDITALKQIKVTLK